MLYVLYNFYLSISEVKHTYSLMYHMKLLFYGVNLTVPERDFRSQPQNTNISSKQTEGQNVLDVFGQMFKF